MFHDHLKKMMILKGRRDMIVDVRSVNVAHLGAYMTTTDTFNEARFDHCLIHCCTRLSVGMMLRLMINTPFVHLSFRSLSLDKILKREFLDSYSEAFTTVDS